jgi:hypothetical protein
MFWFLISFIPLLIILSLIILYFANRQYQKSLDYREHPIRKFPTNFNDSNWKYIDNKINKYFPHSRFNNQPSDIALIDIEKWLNFRLGLISRNIPPCKRNFKDEWQKNLTGIVQKTLKKRDYFRLENCSLESLKSYLHKLHNQNKNNKSTYQPNNDVESSNIFDIKSEYNQSDITLNEFLEALDISGNSQDKYYISYNIIKKLPSIHNQIIKLMNNLTHQTEFSEEWKNGILFLEHKPNKNFNDPENYRPLIKMPLMTRIYHKIITNRIYNYILKNKILNINVQKGYFRNFNGCQENILIVKEIIKDAHKNNNTLSILFLDIENAYGSLSKPLINYCLEQYKFPESISNYIKGYYNQNKCMISVNNKNYDTFDWNIGVYQGDTLASILFIISINIVLNHIYKKYKNNGYHIKGVNTSILAFVDDIILVSNNRDDLMKIYGETSRILEDMGFNLKLNKLRILEIGQQNLPPLIINNHEVIKINNDVEFKHLGTYINLNQDSSEIIKKYCDDLENIFQQIDTLQIHKRPLKNYQKCNIFKINILPKIRWVLLCESWDFDSIKLIENIEIKYLRKWGKTNSEIISILNNTRTIMKESQYKLFSNSIDERIMELSMDYYNINSKIKKQNGTTDFENPLDVKFLTIDDTDYRSAIN